MSPRLWVKKITSVGAVEEGDNPGAEIVFWKRRDAGSGEGFGEPRERGAQQAASDVQRPERRVGERRTYDRRRGPDRRAGLVKATTTTKRKAPTMGRPRLNAHERLEAIVKNEEERIRTERPGLTSAQARSEFWRTPQGAAVAEQLRKVGTVKKSNTPGPTLADQCLEAIDKRANDVVWRNLGGGMTKEAVRAAQWRTPEGQALAGLMRSPYGALPYSKGLEALSKSKDADRHTEALNLLRDGLPG
jgi:hypothetical protein